jgi:hypothetical protein
MYTLHLSGIELSVINQVERNLSNHDIQSREKKGTLTVHLDDLVEGYALK